MELSPTPDFGINSVPGFPDISGTGGGNRIVAARKTPVDEVILRYKGHHFHIRVPILPL